MSRITLAIIAWSAFNTIALFIVMSGHIKIVRRLREFIKCHNNAIQAIQNMNDCHVQHLVNDHGYRKQQRVQ